MAQSLHIALYGPFTNHLFSPYGNTSKPGILGRVYPKSQLRGGLKSAPQMMSL